MMLLLNHAQSRQQSQRKILIFNSVLSIFKFPDSNIHRENGNEDSTLEICKLTSGDSEMK